MLTTRKNKQVVEIPHINSYIDVFFEDQQWELGDCDLMVQILHMKYRTVQLHIYTESNCQEKQSARPNSNWRKQPNSILMVCTEAKVQPMDQKFVQLILDPGKHLPNSRSEFFPSRGK
eukprot:TRINITY_DN11234_c1_g2_i1.p1 TRINITY_DN11234_c1_g2~~TRINITY_DN11234_c1_g2_i1.p1  ORF type:complete len:118 (-),score=10.87 TRINITY_DN11234_c1_g2_i1:102-455(-)